MMKRLAYWLLALLLAGFASCAREEILSDAGVADGGPVDVELSFRSGGLKSVLVTKSTLGEEAESAIYNMYVFLFDSDGNKFYGKLFDGDNLVAKNVTSPALSDWWTISNQSVSGNVDQTTGTLHIRSLAKGAGCKIVVVANIDAEMLNISAEQLKTVATFNDLLEIKARLNQIIVSRSGHFPMTGILEDVSITRKEGNEKKSVITPSNISLKRLDAKIVFNVQVAPGTTEDPVTISSFSPITWNVVNVPKGCYLMERGAYGTAGPFTDAGEGEDDFFETNPANFESETPTTDYYAGTDQHPILIHSFSFYMMENRLSAKASPEGREWLYTDRERQNKNSAGKLTGGFLYANDLSTYVEFSGRLQMAATGNEASTLSAEVRYRVHLGDFGTSFAASPDYSDFRIFRNHTYIYNITIHGVDDIRVEVEGVLDENGNQISPPEERDPGAMGEVSVSRETVLTSDAHYSTHVISFHADYIDASRVTWDVVTPFNPKGASPTFTPEGNEVTTGIDFEWVEFRLNDVNPEDNRYFLTKRQLYRPRKGTNADPTNPTMTVSELVTFLKEQKENYDWNQEHKDDPDFVARSCRFDEDDKPKIVVTAFVNEYYYETNPITGQYEPDLWKKVVNQPMRYMHILSETKTSADGESRVIGASFTIEQKSIQSIYDVNAPGLNSAWGCEHWDDEQNLQIAEDCYWSTTDGTNADRGNTSLSNGRENTLKEWELVDKKGANAIFDQTSNPKTWWSTYLQLEGDYDTPLMTDAYRYLRYSCMARNRDNDGDGYIDEDEIRWYMASENQLMGLFLGSYGIEGDARLYQRDAAQMQSNNVDDWRQHVFASNRYAKGGSNSNNQARLIWAEEGLSGSSLGNYGISGHSDQTTKFGTRCVRNLGHDPSTGASITQSHASVEPDPVIVCKRMHTTKGEYSEKVSANKMDGDVYYIFDCSRLNKSSIRYYTGDELVRHNEFAEQACLYTKFQSTSVNQSTVFTKRSITSINDWLDADENKGKSSIFCPEGYRMCNLREQLVLRYFIPTGDVGTYYSGIQNLSRTWWFFGKQQTDSKYRKMSSFWGFAAGTDKMQKASDVNNHQTNSLRCVKDIKQ